MKRLAGLFAGLYLVASGFVAGGLGVAGAQEMTPPLPPQVLVIQREYLKPGKGSVHERSESAFVRAMAAAKWPTHYFAAESMSGPTRALFFIGYPSFAAWESDNQNTDMNATLAAAMDRAAVTDGDLLTEYDQNVFIFREGMSLRPNVDIPHMRYFEISVYKVRPGHQKDWEELVAMYKDTFEKAIPDARWATFESAYGADNGGTFVVFHPMKSLAEVDQGFADEKKFMDAQGQTGMKRVEELSAACIESSQTNLFRFNPRMSYPDEEWIKADPFWKVKMAAPVKATAAKPEP